MTSHENFDIYPVPPVAWSNSEKPVIDIAENEKLFRFLLDQGVKRIIYGGNALVYHMSLPQYSQMVEWLSGLTNKAQIIPAVGPSYGRALDHAAVVRGQRFSSLLVLPSNSDPHDSKGLESGLRQVAEAAGLPLTLYIKDELNFGSDKEAGLDVIGRLVDAKVCCNIKYAVVRNNPIDDTYLHALIRRVDPSRIISGIGERPAVAHLRDFNLAGFTTGSGVIAPKLCRALLNACRAHDFSTAEDIQHLFMALEDLRDAWGPPKVLHYAVGLAGIASTGPILPYLSPLDATQLGQVETVAKALYARNGKPVDALSLSR